SNGFGFRPDGPNNSFATAAPMDINGNGLFTAQGIIEKMTDKDYFSFTTSGGFVSFLCNVAPYGATLDATLGLYTTSVVHIHQSATVSLAEYVSANLDPGTYEVVVSSAGNYGDVGQYWLSGALGAIVPEPASFAACLLGFLLLPRRRPARL